MIYGSNLLLYNDVIDAFVYTRRGGSGVDEGDVDGDGEEDDVVCKLLLFVMKMMMFARISICTVFIHGECSSW